MTEIKPKYVPVKCVVCNGRGKVNWDKNICHACGGKGYILVEVESGEVDGDVVVGGQNETN